MKSRVVIGLSVTDGSGGPRIALQYARALAERGCRVTLLLPADRRGSPSVLLDNDEISTDYIDRYPSVSPRSLYLGLRHWEAACGRAVLVAPFQADLAYFYLVGKLLGLPVVYLLQNEGDFSGGVMSRTVKRFLAKHMIRSADGLVSVSTNLIRYVGSYCGVAPSRVSLVRNGVVIPKEAKTTDFRRRGWRIVNVGRICQQKNQLLLVEAVARLPSELRDLLEIHFWGEPKEAVDQTYFDTLKQSISQHDLGGTIKLCGWTADIEGKLADADLMVHTARWEGSPLAVLEAYAKGLPVITTPCFDPPLGFAEGIHGWFCRSFAVDELSEKLASVVRHGKARAAEAGLEGRRYTEANLSARQADANFCVVLKSVERAWEGHVL